MMKKKDCCSMGMEEILRTWPNKSIEKEGIAIQKHTDATGRVFFYELMPSARIIPGLTIYDAAERLGIPFYTMAELPADINEYQGIIKEKTGQNIRTAERIIKKEFKNAFSSKTEVRYVCNN